MDRKRLSVWTKLKYGAFDFGMSLVSSMLSFSMLFYYTDVVGVNPGLAGTAMFALIPAIFLIICIPLLIKYPITRKSHEDVLNKLRERRGEHNEN